MPIGRLFGCCIFCIPVSHLRLGLLSLFIFVRLLFESSIYFCGYQQRLNKVCRAIQLAQTVVRAASQFCCQLWKRGVFVHEWYTHSCATCTNRNHYSKVAFISLRASNCAATIRGRQLLEGNIYLRGCLIKEIQHLCPTSMRYWV